MGVKEFTVMGRRPNGIGEGLKPKVKKIKTLLVNPLLLHHLHTSEVPNTSRRTRGPTAAIAWIGRNEFLLVIDNTYDEELIRYFSL